MDASKQPPDRQTVDLARYPDLVVIYLGMRANSLRGLRTLVSFGPKITKAVGADPDGLLLHENLLYSLFPLHTGTRQYWRDFESLERWARTGVHATWWKGFLVERGGVGFWHETYSGEGQIESVYIDMPPVGLSRFAPREPARGSMFSARKRLGRSDEAEFESAVAEEQLHEG